LTGTGKDVKKKWILGCGLTIALIAGSAHIKYFFQAAYGQLALIASARSIEKVLADPSVDPDLKAKLAKVNQIRDFAIRELKLPDSDSYETYVEIDRPYVVWNVIATPELSMRPVEWCFPVAGCASYRGYYNKADALAFARSMQLAGYDVHVAEVPAYSTLGWFNDPVISTFIHYSEPQLARLIFHELAHQVLYVPGDSQFNESFAVAIEEEGVERWIARQGNEAMLQAHITNTIRKREFLALLAKYQARLADNYASVASAEKKRAEKARILNALQDEFLTVKVGWKGYSGYDGWFARPLNNAHLASIATYHTLVPGFRALMKKQVDFQEFYGTAKSLASLPQRMRQEQLAELGKESTRSIPVEQVKVGQGKS
jgi:predicted aminopeptidase